MRDAQSLVLLRDSGGEKDLNNYSRVTLENAAVAASANWERGRARGLFVASENLLRRASSASSFIIQNLYET
jgi:hypothetical protein